MPPPTKEYLLAALVPVLMHTLYDACTVCNKFLTDENEDMQNCAKPDAALDIVFLPI